MRVELLADGIGQNGILHGDQISIRGAAGRIYVVVWRKFYRNMVVNHVRAVAHVDAVLGGTGDAARTDANKADNFICPRAERNLVADDGNAAARRGLAGDGQAAGTGDGAGEGDGAAHIKDNETVAGADAGAERSRAAVIRVGHVINRAAKTRTHGVCAEAECAGKRRDIRLQRAYNQIHLTGRVCADGARGARGQIDGQRAKRKCAAVGEQRVSSAGESAAGGDVQRAAQIQVAADNRLVAARAERVVQNRAAVRREIIIDRQSAGRISRRENAAAVDRDRSADAAAAAQSCAAGDSHRAAAGAGAGGIVHEQSAFVDGRAAAVSVVAGQRHRSAVGQCNRAGSADDHADG